MAPNSTCALKIANLLLEDQSLLEVSGPTQVDCYCAITSLKFAVGSGPEVGQVRKDWIRGSWFGCCRTIWGTEAMVVVDQCI